MGQGDDGSLNELVEWAQGYFRIPNKEYGKLAGAFNLIGFDAEAWVRLAKEAGINYIVVTSKHYGGFAISVEQYIRIDALGNANSRRAMSLAGVIIRSN